MTLPPRPFTLQTPASWVAEYTEPTIAEFRADPLSPRRAVNAVREVYHVHERIYQYWCRVDPDRVHRIAKDTLFTEYLRGISRDFIALGDAADASKHHVLRSTTRLVATASMVSTVTDGVLTIGPGGPKIFATIDALMALYRTTYL